MALNSGLSILKPSRVCWYSAGNHKGVCIQHPSSRPHGISHMYFWFVQNLLDSPKIPTSTPETPSLQCQKTHLCFVATRREPIPRSLHNSLPGVDAIPCSIRIPGFINGFWKCEFSHPKKKRQILKTKQCVCVSNDSKVAETHGSATALEERLGTDV